jgi:hypothetical protein
VCLFFFFFSLSLGCCVSTSFSLHCIRTRLLPL